MKLRLVLKTETKNKKESSIKFNIAPSKQQGIMNFINLAMSQDQPISLTFEKISKSGEREESKVEGIFKFDIQDLVKLKELADEIENIHKRKRKEHQKRIH
jgi:hypothetical protein